MVADISTIAKPLVVFLGAFVLIVVTIILLTYLEKKLRKNIELQKKEESFYRVRIGNVKSLIDDPHKFLPALNNLAQEFFAKEFNVELGLGYVDIIEIFNKKNRLDIVKFCEEMQEASYGGKQLDKKYLEYLLNELVFLIRKQKKFEEQRDDVSQNKNIANKIVNSYADAEKKIERKIESEASLIKEKIIQPVKEEDELTEEAEAIKKKILKEKKSSKHNVKSFSYQGYIKSIDNLDRVKEKLIRAGKPMRF